MGFDCFISYRSDDLAIAERLHSYLQEQGFSVWFDKIRLQPGYNWHKEIEAGCEESRVVLPILTPRWKSSEWTRFETYGAEVVIPLIFEGEWDDVSTPPLSRYHNALLTLNNDYTKNWALLAVAIRELVARPAPDKSCRIIHLRYPPNPHFVGRETTLNNIHEKLFRNPTAALTQGRTEAITALGGIGKTTLARQYAEKFWRCYPQMFWVDCRLQIESEFAKIFDILFPSNADQNLRDQDKATRALQELQQVDGRPLRLLILDNVENEESIMRWIPRTGTCHTIITSRFTAWSPGINTTPVWVLEKEPAQKLLLSRAGRSNESMECELTACDSLAEKLGYLPLALEQAGAYVGNEGPGFGFVDYLRLLNAYERDLLDERSLGSTEYPDSVITTWRATIEKLPSGSRTMLRIAAFLAPTPLALEMFMKKSFAIAERSRQFDDQPDRTSVTEIEMRRWTRTLISYSMVVQSATDGFMVHGLVQAVERYSTPEAEKADWIKTAMGLVAAYGPKPSFEFKNWPIWKQLLPHSEGVLNYARRQQQIQLDADLLQEVADYLNFQGRYAESERYMKQALSIRERTLGPENPNTMTSLNNMAILLSHLGKYAEALDLSRKALEVNRRVLGPSHFNVGANLINIGSQLRKLGRYGEAEEFVKEAIELYTRTLGPEHPDTLKAMAHLGVIYADSDDPRGVDLFCKLVDLGERSQVDDPEQPNRIFMLARLIEIKGDLSEAERLYRRALDGQVRLLGADHPFIFRTKSSLGSLLLKLGKPEEAIANLRESADGFTRSVGSNHPDTLLTRSDLAALLLHTGKTTEGEVMLQEASSGLLELFDERHPNFYRSLLRLGYLCYAKGQLSEAENYYTRALTVIDSHNFAISRAGVLRDLALLHHAKGDLPKTRQYYQLALNASEQYCGRDQASALPIIYGLAAASDLGDVREAEELRCRAGELVRNGVEKNVPLSSAMLINYLLGRDLKENEEKKTTYRRIAEECERTLGPDDPKTLDYRRAAGI